MVFPLFDFRPFEGAASSREVLRFSSFFNAAFLTGAFGLGAEATLPVACLADGAFWTYIGESR